MALTAHGQPTSKSLDILAARYAMLAAKREIGANTKSQHPSGQSEVRKLRALAEQAAANKPDPIRALADAIRMLAADFLPYPGWSNLPHLTPIAVIPRFCKRDACGNFCVESSDVQHGSP